MNSLILRNSTQVPIINSDIDQSESQARNEVC